MLNDLGCAYNGFSLEYDDGQGFAGALARAGEQIDFDALSMSTLMAVLEDLCDRVHEQILLCQEARRILLFLAHLSVACDEAVKTLHSKQATLPENDTLLRADLTLFEQHCHDLEAQFKSLLEKGLSEVRSNHKQCLKAMADVCALLSASLADYHGSVLARYQ